MRLHTLVRAAAGLSVAAALAAAWPASAAPFRLISTDIETALVPNSVIDLALSEGYFAREGVDVAVVKVQQTPSAVAALQAGEGEMANISIEAALQMVARGQMDLRAVTSPNKYPPYLIAGKTDIADIHGLAGRSFGVGRVGSLDHTLTAMVLRAAGMDPASVDFVPIGQPPARAQALVAGAIDASTMSIGVWMGVPDKSALHVIVPVAQFAEGAPVVGKVNVVSAETLANRRGEIEAVVRALIKASRDYDAEPQKWVEAMVRARPDVPRADLETLAEAFRGSWSVNGGLSAQELSFSEDQTYGSEDFAGLPKLTLSQWVDFSIVDGILKEIGTDPSADTPTR